MPPLDATIQPMPDTSIKEGLDTPDIIDTSKDKAKQIDKMPINQDKRVIYAKFTPEQQEEIKTLIEKEMRRYRNIFEADGFYDKVDKCKEKFNASHDDDSSTVISGDYNIKIPIQKLIVRTLVDRAIRQMFQANPLVLMEREGPMSEDDLHVRQNKLDFVLRNQLRFEELCRSIFEHAIYEPVCITETLDFYDVEQYSTTIETYEPTPEGISRFEKDFGMVNDEESLEFKNRVMLQSGQPVTVPVTGPKVIYDGPKVSRIENDKFFADPRQKDFRKMRVHGKQVDFTWAEIEMRSNSEKYNWDKDAVEKIKKTWGEDFKNKTIPFFEMVILYDKDKNDKIRRYTVTMEAKSREIVRTVIYTNEEMQNTSHSVNPSDDSWIGESLLDMINELCDMIMAKFNYMLYSDDLAHTPVIATDDPNSVTRKAIDLGVVNIIPAPKGTAFTQLTFGNTGYDRMGLLQTLFDMVYMLSGVNVPALSGNTQAKDPRAGVGKQALAQQVTNLRIEDMVTRLLYGIAQVVEKVEKIMIRNTDKLDYWDGEKEIKVNKTIYGSPVRYVMHGSKLSFNPEMDIECIMKWLQICQGLSPATLAIDEVRRDILAIVTQDIGGSIAKHKEKIIGYMDAYIKVKQAMQKAQQGQPQAQGQPTDKPIPEMGMGAGGGSIPSNQSGMPQADGGSGTVSAGGAGGK
jgi:hypothetical protein